MIVRNDILVVSDSRYEMESIQDLLKPEYGLVLKTPLEQDGIRLFKKHHPKLLILAYEDVAQAEAFYLTIYEKDPDIHEAAHKTLLLCRGQQSELAYELCFNGIMDDYVADRPLFDPHRLLLSVRNAIDSYDSEQKSIWFMHQIDKSQQDLNDLYHYLQKHLIGAKSLNAEIELTFDQYIERLKSDLRELENQVSPLFGIDAPIDKSEELFSEAMSTLENNAIAQSSEPVKESISTAQAQNNQLDNDIKKFLASLGKESESEIAKTKVLIVDDDPMYLTIVESMLESDDIQISCVTDAQGAIQSINSEIPDIILLDYLMPEINGLMLLKKIKSHAEWSSIPVIMLTGDASREVVASCIKNGASEYVIKPGSREQLVEKIKLLTET